MDADSLKFLEEVRKGKPRRFAMLMKGEKIISLVVYKKGPIEKYRKQAKEEGAGQFYFGVIDGKGQNVAFKLCIADGFEAPPGKDVKLKQYLNEESGLQFKPVYEIVAELPAISDADDVGEVPAAPPLPAQAAAAEAPPAAPPAPPAATDGADFMTRLKSLLPQLKVAQDTPSPLQADFKTKMATMQGQAKSGDFGSASQSLDELERMAQQVQSGGTPPAAPPAAPAADDGLIAKLTDTLAKMTPLIKQALGIAPERKNDVLQPAADIKQLLAEGNAAAAKDALMAYGSTLKQIMGGGNKPAPSAAELLATWREAKEAVDAQLEKFRGALTRTGDAYLSKIATGGVEMFIAGPDKQFVTLQKSLFDLQNATPDTRAQFSKNLLSAVKSYRSFVNTNPFIDVCDANRLCGPLKIRQTLDTALASLEQSVGQMAA